MSLETSTGRPLDENEINFEANSNDAESGLSPDDFVDHEVSPELTPVPTSEANRSSEPPPEIISQFGAGEWKRTYNEYSETSTSTFDFVKGEMLDAQDNSLTEEIRTNSTPEQIALHDEILSKWKNGEAAYITYFETVGEETIINTTKTWVESNGVVASETWSCVYEKPPIELAPPQAIEGDDEGGADDGVVVVKVEAASAPTHTPSEPLAKKEGVNFFVEPTITRIVTEGPKNVTKTETQIVPTAIPVDLAKIVSSLKTEIVTAATTESSGTLGEAEFVSTPISLPTQEIKTTSVETTATERPVITIIEAQAISEVNEPTEIKKEPLIISEKTKQEIPTAPLEITGEKSILDPEVTETRVEAGQTKTTVIKKNAILIETNQEDSPEPSITENPIAEQIIVFEQREKPLVAEHTITFENRPQPDFIETVPTVTETKDSISASPETNDATRLNSFPLSEKSGITLEMIDDEPETKTAAIETNFQPNIMWSPEKNAVAVPEEIKPLEKSGIEIEIIDEPAEIVENTVEPVNIVTESLKDEEVREPATKIITPEITGIVLDEKIEPKVETVITPSLIIAPEIIMTTEINDKNKIIEVPLQTDIPVNIHKPIAATAPEKSTAVIPEQISDIGKPEAQKMEIDKSDIQKIIIRPIATAAPTPRPNIWRAPRPRAESTAVRKNKSAAHAETLAVATNAAPNFIRQERPRAVARVLNVLRPVELVRALTRRRPAQIPDTIEDSRPPARLPLTRYAANS